MSAGPALSYNEKIRSGRMEADPAQKVLAGKLQNVYDGLVSVNKKKVSKIKLLVGLKAENKPLTRGLYIYGGVGTGKSTMMDLFYDQVKIEAKRRVHFHEFLQDVHRRFNNIRKSENDPKGDPIPKVIDQIASEVSLLCFDELQVYNIVDAMILGRLFEGLFSKGVIIIATSNRPPEDLYKDGLQRQKFLPFIDLINDYLEVFRLKGKRDYRLERMLEKGVYLCPADQNAKLSMDNYFFEFTGGRKPETEIIEVLGRSIRMDASVGVARKSFKELCQEALGAADYLAIASRYHTLLLEGVRCMSESNESEARRFVNLIDALYEAKVKLICSADSEPEGLYLRGQGIFEFDRLVSRLMEMQSTEYLSLPHISESK